MLQFLIARGAQVCRLRSPLSPTHHGVIGASPPRCQAAEASLRGYADAYRLRYVDGNNLLPLQDSEFADPDHLTCVGSVAPVPEAIQACFG